MRNATLGSSHRRTQEVTRTRQAKPKHSTRPAHGARSARATDPQVGPAGRPPGRSGRPTSRSALPTDPGTGSAPQLLQIRPFRNESCPRPETPPRPLGRLGGPTTWPTRRTDLGTGAHSTTSANPDISQSELPRATRDPRRRPHVPIAPVTWTATRFGRHSSSIAPSAHWNGPTARPTVFLLKTDSTPTVRTNRV